MFPVLLLARHVTEEPATQRPPEQLPRILSRRRRALFLGRMFLNLNKRNGPWCKSVQWETYRSYRSGIQVRYTGHDDRKAGSEGVFWYELAFMVLVAH